MSTARDALVAARDAVQAEIDKIDKFVTDTPVASDPAPTPSEPPSVNVPAEVPPPAAVTPEPGSNDAPAVHETAASEMAAQVAAQGDVKPVWDAPAPDSAPATKPWEGYTAPDPLEPAS